jgi:hypothetical protein
VEAIMARRTETLDSRTARATTSGAPTPLLRLVEPGFDGVAPGGTPGASADTTAPGRSATVPDRLARAQVEQALERHRGLLLGLPGVLSVRRGYKVTDGWISTTPAIVVTVRKKELAPALSIPSQLDGVLVDVAPATPREQLLALPASEKKKYDLSVTDELEELVRTSRYQAPPHLSLQPVEAAMTVLCHASPDAGFPTLKGFLAETTQRLTVGMYDFTAPHVKERLIAAMRDVRGALRLVLDPKIALGAPGEGDNPKANDETEDVVREALANALGTRFEFVWAAVKLAGKTTAGIFPSAYHIKVAVRDGRAFWLSSGNWQSSNQPDLDPLHATAPDPDVLRTYNREWHVVVDHAPLAQLLEQYLEWDMEQAGPLQVGPEVSPLPELIVPPAPEAAEIVPARYFPPKLFTFTAERPLRVLPLLSPDNYAAQVLELVRSARHKLYIQNQYIKTSATNPDRASSGNAPEFQAVLDAVRKCIDEGVEVRIIVRDLPDTRQQLEALRDAGFDLATVRVLSGTHTKGIVVDSSVVMVGSHNWSSDGVVYNRDASLIFYDADIAKYYEELFIYDWSRARQQLHFESAMPIIAGSGAEAAAVGHVAMPWNAIYED